MSDSTQTCWLGGKVTDRAHDADQAVRAIIGLTLLPHPIPAPDVYQTLAELEDLAFALDRVLRHHLEHALEASLASYPVHDRRDPQTSVAWAATASTRPRTTSTWLVAPCLELEPRSPTRATTTPRPR